MLIRASGYNTGAQEYLEQGNKSGREFTRDELDHRLILDGQLSVTREIYESIPDHGQDRYLTFTMSFKEDHVDPEVLKAITAEFKSFLMHAYAPGEFNFYAEAHLPKIKEVQDKKTGEMIQRKPHIHIIVPRINLLSGNEANPVDVYMKHEKYFEAFQEYINQNYGLASPRESMRADIEDAASVLSRYKADDFYGKNRQFKQGLVTDVIERGINNRADFYAMVAEHGETRVRNEGKDNEYLAVKLPGDAKFTNLKETIFQDEFIVRRSLRKPPLDPAVIQARLQQWPQRSKEIKYIHKMASPANRERYWSASPEERVSLLAKYEHKFYQTYGGQHDDKFVSSSRDRQRGPAEAQHPGHHATADGLPHVSISDVASNGQAEPTRQVEGPVLLPGHAHVHVGQRDEGGDPGLRSAVPGGRGRRGRTSVDGRGPEKSATLPAQTAREPVGSADSGRNRSAGRSHHGRRGRPVGSDELPPDARNPHRVRSMGDIEQRGRRLFDVAGDPAEQPHLVHAGNPAPGSAGQPASRKRRRKLGDADARPPDARNPHRVRSMADIEQRGRRLFGAANSPAALSPLGHASSPDAESAGQRTPRKKQRRFDTTDPRPPHARNPHRVGSMADIKARSRRLFDSSGPEDPARLAKRPSLKPLLINRTASTVAAYFTREAEQNQLMPAQRRALRRLNKQYFDSRRSVFSDPRLTRQDKAQLASVLAFERLKAREAIQNPQHHQEVVLMGSAEIRNLIQGAEEETPAPAFSFTGARGPNMDKRPAGIRVQVKGILDKLSKRLEPAQKERDEERERELNAKDLYTRKATFSQNVHYLDKKTDKTLFVDTGKAIAMRRTGITEAGVAVALELAKERFGSTLSINGTAEFKQLVIEAAAKNGIDVHFTDKAMNQALADRRAMLDIEKEGNTLGPSASQPAPEPKVSAQVPQLAPTQFLHNDVVVTVDPADAAAVGVFKTQLESEVDLRGQAIDTTTSEISDVEMQISDWADSPGDSALGVLVKHGFAPYQHDAKNKQSYFVDIDTGAGGVRTIWGADLSRSLDQGQHAVGDRIRLQDLGQVPVQVPEKVEGGGTKLVDAYRREWSVKNADGPSLAELKVQLASAQTLLMTHSAMKAQAESSLAKLAKVATVEAAPAPAPAPALAPVPASSELVVEADNWADAMNAALNSHYDYGQQERSAEYSQAMTTTDIAAVAKLEEVGYGPDAVQHEDKTFALDRLMRAARREIDSNPDYRTFIEANAPKDLVERIQAAEPLPDREPFAETANSTEAKPGFDSFTDLDPAQRKGPAPIHFVHNGKDVKLDLSRYTVPAAESTAVSATTASASHTDAGTAPLDLAQLDTKWRADNGLATDETAIPDAAMADRGALHAAWGLSGAERSSNAMALIGNLMENPAYKSGFERAVDKPDLRTAALGGRETSELVNMDRVWRQNLGMPESDIVATPTAMEMRGESHANWLYGTADKSPQAIAMLSNYLQDDAYRQGFKRGIDELYALPMLPADRAVLDSAVEFVFDLVNDIEQKKYGQVIEDPSADVGPDLESAPLDGWAEGGARVETYTDAHIQVEEDGPEMD